MRKSMKSLLIVDVAEGAAVAKNSEVVVARSSVVVVVKSSVVAVVVEAAVGDVIEVMAMPIHKHKTNKSRRTIGARTQPNAVPRLLMKASTLTHVHPIRRN